MFSNDVTWADPAQESVGERRRRKQNNRRRNSVESTNSSVSELSTVRPSRGNIGRAFNRTIGRKLSIESTADSARAPSVAQSSRTERAIKRSPNYHPRELVAHNDWASSNQSSPSPSVATPQYVQNPWGGTGYFPEATERSPVEGRVWPAVSRAENALGLRAQRDVKGSYVTIESPKHRPLIPVAKTEIHVKEISVEKYKAPLELPVQGHEVGPQLPPVPPKTPICWPSGETRGTVDQYITPTPVDELGGILQTVTVSVSDETIELEPIEADAKPVVEPRAKPLAPLVLKPVELERPIIAAPASPSNLSHWRAPSDWDYCQKDQRAANDETTPEPIGSAEPNGRYFEKFLGRMDGAGSRVLLNRLREQWGGSFEAAVVEEMSLEKYLVALTALHLTVLDRFVKKGSGDVPCPIEMSAIARRDILELDGNIGEVYRAAAIYRESKIFHLSRDGQCSNIALPTQASKHPLPGLYQADSNAEAYPFLPLPYANASMHHVRSSRLATLLSAAQLPQLVAEVHRVLRPGGIFELRVINALPERSSTGPKLAEWLEENLQLNLESNFMCHRPMALVPSWLKQKGFQPLPARDGGSGELESSANNRRGPSSKIDIRRCLQVPVVSAPTGEGTGAADTEAVILDIAVLAARTLWEDTWGRHVSEDAGGFWWDDEELVKECLEWGTYWEIGTVIVSKPLT